MRTIGILLATLMTCFATPEITLLKKEDVNHWKRKSVAGRINFLGSDNYIEIAEDRKQFVVSGPRLKEEFRGERVTVADYWISKGHILLYLERKIDPGGAARDFHGILICTLGEREVVSKLYCGPNERKLGKKYKYYLNGVYSFGYPVVTAQVVVMRIDRQPGDLHGFWQATLRLNGQAKAKDGQPGEEAIRGDSNVERERPRIQRLPQRREEP